MSKEVLDLIDAAVDEQQREIPSDAGLSRVSSLAARAREIDEDVERLNARIDGLTLQRREIAEKLLPAVMKELRLESFKLDDGFEVVVQPAVYAHIKEDNREAAHRWLRENGFEALIKREFKVSFGKGENGSAVRLMQYLEEMEFGYTDKALVAPQTLQAFVREQINKGKDGRVPPVDIFGVHVVDVASIKPPAGAKKTKEKGNK